MLLDTAVYRRIHRERGNVQAMKGRVSCSDRDTVFHYL